MKNKINKYKRVSIQVGNCITTILNASINIYDEGRIFDECSISISNGKAISQVQLKASSVRNEGGEIFAKDISGNEVYINFSWV